MRLRSSLRAARARGFSLAELIVAVGILALMLALTGQVFNATTKSTGQATALTQVSQVFRDMERTLREDLRNVDRENSLIVIHANPINAYWTQDGKLADDDNNPWNGYPHEPDPEREWPSNGNLVPPRADVLMIFSARKAKSYVFPDVRAQAQQVVYGHADLGDYVQNPPGVFLFQPNYTAAPQLSDFAAVMIPPPAANSLPNKIARNPAERWHLARRSVLLSGSASPVDDNDDPMWASELDADSVTIEFGSVLKGSTDVVGEFSYEESVLTPGLYSPNFWPEILRKGNNFPRPFARSQLDPAPPTFLARRLGHYFVPRCASFKVEWTLDPNSQFVDGRLDAEREVIWFDPGDLPDPNAGSANQRNPLRALEWAIADAQAAGQGQRKNTLEELLEDPLGDPTSDNGQYSLEDRFTDGDSEWHGNTPQNAANFVVFSAGRRARNSATLDPPAEIIPEDVFPAALRITVDVYDASSRLPRPIRHVMVIPVGR